MQKVQHDTPGCLLFISFHFSSFIFISFHLSSSFLLLWRRCEAWTRPAGIQATREVAGYQCLEAWAARVGPCCHPSQDVLILCFGCRVSVKPRRSANATYSAGLLCVRLEVHVGSVGSACRFGWKCM